MQRKPRAGRVWGHFALQQEVNRAIGVCPSYDEQPDGADRRDRGSSAPQTTLQGKSDQRFQLRGQGYDRMDHGLGKKKLDKFAEKARAEQRSLGRTP